MLLTFHFLARENSGFFGDSALHLCIYVGQEIFNFEYFEEKIPS